MEPEFAEVMFCLQVNLDSKAGTPPLLPLSTFPNSETIESEFEQVMFCLKADLDPEVTTFLNSRETVEPEFEEVIFCLQLNQDPNPESYPFASTYQSFSHSQNLPHHSHITEDRPSTLSPSHKSQFSRQTSVYDTNIQSPMTPVGSPYSDDSNSMSSTWTPVTREDIYVSIYDWMDKLKAYSFPS